MVARKKTVKKTPQTAVLVSVPDATDDEPETVEEAIEREEVEEALTQANEAASDVPSRTYVRLYRSHPALGNREMLCDSFDADIFSQDYVRETYGGGRFRAQFMGPRRGKAGKIATGPLKEVRFDVDLTIPVRHPKATVPDAGSAPAVTGDVSTGRRIDAALEGATLSLLEGFSQMNRAQLEMMQAATKGNQTNWGPILAAIVPSVTALLTTVLGNRRDPVEVAREIAAMQQQDKRGNMVGELREMLELVEKLRGGESLSDSGEGEPWQRMLERVGVPLLQSVMSSPRQDAPPPPVPADVTPTPSPLLPNPPVMATATPNEPMKPEVMALRAYVPQLIQWATQGRSAQWAAETLLYEIPQGFHAMLHERLKSETLVGELTNAVPALAPFPSWLEELRAALVEDTLPEGEELSDDTD